MSILILINLFFLCSCHFRSGLQFGVVCSLGIKDCGIHLERKIRDSFFFFIVYRVELRNKSSRSLDRVNCMMLKLNFVN